MSGTHAVSIYVEWTLATIYIKLVQTKLSESLKVEKITTLFVKNIPVAAALSVWYSIHRVTCKL